jgi:hypothetical protein
MESERNLKNRVDFFSKSGELSQMPEPSSWLNVLTSQSVNQLDFCGIFFKSGELSQTPAATSWLNVLTSQSVNQSL